MHKGQKSVCVCKMI